MNPLQALAALIARAAGLETRVRKRDRAEYMRAKLPPRGSPERADYDRGMNTERQRRHRERLRAALPR
jgi:hypothetical protein